LTVEQAVRMDLVHLATHTREVRRLVALTS
jgi:hypothetical protein